MGKRSNFERNERDYYRTPEEALIPLLPHIDYITFNFIEPCAGDGTLTSLLLKYTDGKCLYQSDIEPQESNILRKNVLDIEDKPDYYITNPPWDRSILHPMIFHLTSLKPTWLLFDADWMHTRQSAIFQKMLKKVVSIGRIKWIKDSKGTGKDNCCWYLFDEKFDGTTEFYGRVE